VAGRRSIGGGYTGDRRSASNIWIDLRQLTQFTGGEDRCNFDASGYCRPATDEENNIRRKQTSRTERLLLPLRTDRVELSIRRRNISDAVTDDKPSTTRTTGRRSLPGRRFRRTRRRTPTKRRRPHREQNIETRSSWTSNAAYSTTSKKTSEECGWGRAQPL